MCGRLRFVLGLRLQPLVRLLLRLFFLNAVALLQAAHKLVLASGHEFQVVVGELAPLLPDHALHLLPLTFHLIPVHNFRLRIRLGARPDCAPFRHEPPAAKAARSLAASTKASPPGLLTTGEKSDWNETAPYAEAVEISRRLERASRFVKVLDIGASPEGRTMIALVVSKDRAFTPEAAARTGKVILLIQSGIHAGEIEGKDPALMLVRDMVVSKKYAAWLDRMIFVIIPVFNVDGHEYFSPYHRPSQNGPKSTGLRANAQRMNLNRDYIKADTPEMRAWLKIFNTWNPDFHIDNHVTDGSDFQYDVTWDMARNQDIAEPAGSWVPVSYTHL